MIDTLLDVFQANLQQILVMGVLLVLSSLFSGTETALFSLRTGDLNACRRRNSAVDQAILALHGQLSEFLMTVLFCNMIVNILFFASSTVLATDLINKLGPAAGVAFGLICLLLVITFGEVTPKSMATFARLQFASIMAIPMYTAHRGLWPVRAILGSVVRWFENVANVREPAPTVKAEELSLLLDMSREEGVISSREQEFINAVIGLPRVRIGEIMTPRVDVVALTIASPTEEALALARRCGRSKIPVRDPERDELIGWVDAREIFSASEPAPLRAYLRPGITLSEFDHADQALDRLLEARERLAIVVDERGATAGILTLSDILSEIVGELGDEHEPPEEPIRAQGTDTYLLDGNVAVREWREAFGIAGELPSVATVAGLVTALLGRMARVGDTVRLGNIEMKVAAVRRRRITEIQLTLLAQQGDDAEGGAS